MSPKEFYLKEKEKSEVTVKALKKTALTLSMGRLSSFLAIPIWIYFLIPQSVLLFSGTVVLIILFLFLVRRSASCQEQLSYQKNRLEIIESELSALNGDYSKHNGGEDYQISQHDFANDLDIFGERSIFQLLNRAATEEGEELLAHFINENVADKIEAKQKALEELKDSPESRLHFHAQAKAVKKESTPQEIYEYFSEYKPFIPRFWRIVTPIFVLGSLALSVLSAVGVLPYVYLLYWFFLGCGITAIYFKRVTDVQQKLDKARYIFQTYAKLIEHLESQDYESEILRKHHAVFKNDGGTYSIKLRRLHEYLNALDQRQNMVFALIGAGLLLWDIQQMLKIERWIKDQSSTVGTLFEEIAFFDAYYALAHYNYLNADYVQPTLNVQGKYEAENIVHPLMDAKQAVSNSYMINKGDFFIITGANMAGKSTFLRTVGTSIVMANLGLRIRAKSFSYTPIKVISSMRTEDSLQDNESYFFAELQRLQFINNSIKEEECFVILDEILKGTNSKDKAEGSQKYIATLLTSKATGIIATHDLSLCEMANSHKEISNYCFEAQIENDELTFDYKFKPGICQNMNASFLLKKMGLVQD
ncbi:MAG: DNA mismatch repair protein MutS [Crocinitomicaceae bacterium]|nr:DNA mismatch repair protein MutS [Crocinitomicaceae bacterium]